MKKILILLSILLGLLVGTIMLMIDGAMEQKKDIVQEKLNSISKYKINVDLERNGIDIGIKFIFEDEINTFPSGAYKLKYAPNTDFVLSNIDKLISEANIYINNAKKIKVKVTGVADGVQPQKKSKYYGKKINVEYFKNENNTEILTLKNGETFHGKNIAYAVLRALSFKEKLQSSSEILENATFNIYAKVSNEVGGEYRKASIYINLVNSVNFNIFSTKDLNIKNFKIGLEKIFQKDTTDRKKV